jgi:hypothetical protein
MASNIVILFVPLSCWCGNLARAPFMAIAASSEPFRLEKLPYTHTSTQANTEKSMTEGENTGDGKTMTETTCACVSLNNPAKTYTTTCQTSKRNSSTPTINLAIGVRAMLTITMDDVDDDDNMIHGQTITTFLD